AGQSPSLAHVTVSNSSTKAIYISNSSPVINNCAFLNNATGGITNSTPAVVVDSRNSYWGTTDGPSGSGPGTGQSVSTGITYEPWITSAPSDPQWFSSNTILNRTFHAPAQTTMSVVFTSTLSGSWTMKILTTGGTLIRTVTGSGSSGTAVWD